MTEYKKYVKEKDSTNTSNNKDTNEEEEEQVVFNACIFNCSYAEQQILEDEKEKEGNIKRNHPKCQKWKQINTARSKDRDQKTDVLVADSLSEETLSMDDRSLLDYDSSNSWESAKRNR